MPVPFSNMEDIIYCHSNELAHELFYFLREKGYSVGLSNSQINTGTHGKQAVKRIDVFKKKAETVDCEECGGSGFSKAGTGYDAVCDNCGGQGVLPK